MTMSWTAVAATAMIFQSSAVLGQEPSTPSLPGPSTEISGADSIQVAEGFAQTFADTWNRQDGIGYGLAYWPDAELVDPTGAVWTGREAISEMHVQLWQGPARGTMTTAAVRRARMLAPHLLIIDLDVRVAGFSPAPPGATVDKDGVVTTRLKHVVEQRGGEWRIIASQNTFVAVLPPR